MVAAVHTLTLLPAEKTIRVSEGENLMQALIGHAINLRSDCGGKGVCGKCTVEITGKDGIPRLLTACTAAVDADITVRIPESSVYSTYIISKAPASLPAAFSTGIKHAPVSGLGIAVDLGTTTIALYLCDPGSRTVLSSIAVKNPQALFGDDVMSRIGAIGRDPEKLARLQQLAVQAIEWGIQQLFAHCRADLKSLTRMVVVGNPAMIHIFLGVSPHSIGIAPYLPAFFRARRTSSTQLGFTLPPIGIHTLGQTGGFIGGDILSAALATELTDQPPGTLLVDLGTNGELVVKGGDGLFATSCATGPAFEGASLSCGMQATPGAIDGVTLADRQALPHYSLITASGSSKVSPAGLCGSGVIGAVAALLRAGIVDASGKFIKEPAIPRLRNREDNGWRYVIAEKEQTATGSEIFLSQKDIRAVQLGKAALITGIEFLLRAAGIARPAKIIIAGAFGSYLDKDDMLTLGMLPAIDPSLIEIAGNSAGAGAIMALCDDAYLIRASEISGSISVIDLTADSDFQNTFIQRLSF